MKPNKKFYFFSIVLIALILFVVLFIYFNSEDYNSFTNADRKWLSENQNIRFDIETMNDYPIYGDNGVFNKFIKDLEKATELDFNVITRSRTANASNSTISFKIIKEKGNITDNDVLLNEDVYIALSLKENKYNEISDFENVTFGVLSTDVGDVSYYLKQGRNLTYKTYSDVDKLFDSLEDSSVDLIVIPNIMYLDHTIGEKKYYINYVFTEMSNKIVLSLNDSNADLNKIVRKYFEKWKNDYFIEEYNKTLLNYYIDNNNINDKTEKDILSKTYVYGYIDNIPYETVSNKQLKGIAGEYIDRIKRLTGIEFEYKKYKTLEELSKAVENKEIDLFFNYYNIDSTSYLDTVSTYIEKYVVLGKPKDNYVINSFEALRGERVNIIGDNALYSYFKDNSKASLSKCESVSELTKNNDHNLVIVDYEVYNYYKNKNFNDYEVLYTGIMTNDYYFMINNSDVDFYNLFNYIISTNSYYNYRNRGLNNLNVSILDKTNFEDLYIVLFCLITIPLIFISVVVVLLRKNKKIKLIKKDERKKYTDMLTSLKNRNYLNLNIKTWNESKKYPQSIIIVDLNNINYVNDNYGYEAGDKLIIKAASLLVSTQLEKSEIIRTDGNEFLIYLVGYSEQQIATYTKKLSKEMRHLPYEFGAAIGYSIINDDIKTIEDAINEASIEMRKDKEEFK